MSQGQPAAAGGIGVVELLGAAFVVMKIAHVINWSWWLVTLPFWGPISLVLVIAIIVLIVTFVQHH